MGFLKATIFEQGIGPSSDFAMKDGKSYFHEEEVGIDIDWFFILILDFSRGIGNAKR